MSHRGRVNALLSLITGLGNASGPRVMGSYIKNREVRMIWLVIFVLSIVAAFGMYILNLKELKDKSKIRKSSKVEVIQ